MAILLFIQFNELFYILSTFESCQYCISSACLFSIYPQLIDNINDNNW